MTDTDRHDDLADFLRRLGALLGAGIPFADALDTFRIRPDSEAAGELARRGAAVLRRGGTFSEALAEFPELFGPQLLAYVRRAERIGNLDRALPELATLIEQDAFPVGPAPGGSADTRPPEAPENLERLDEILLEAARSGADAVHLEATEAGGLLRVRLDGRLVAQGSHSAEEHRDLVAAAKLAAGLDVAEHRLPQEGSYQLDSDDLPQSFEMVLTPCAPGETLVMRRVRRIREVPRLDEIFQDPELTAAFRRLVTRPQGLVLIAGPSGSGRTSTLYAALACRDLEHEKVVTVEDPVELEVPGLQQIPADYSIGFSCQKALRSALRCDPDVVALGELRSHEAVQILLQGALSGRLTLSCLHARDSADALFRMRQVVDDPGLVGSALAGVLAQQLVRRLCPTCRQPDPEGQEALGELGAAATEEGAPPAEGGTIYRATGCSACTDGYRGRVALHELLPLTPRLQELLASPSTTRTELVAAARSEGWHDFRRTGRTLLRAGTTSLPELRRVLGPLAG